MKLDSKEYVVFILGRAMINDLHWEEDFAFEECVKLANEFWNSKYNDNKRSLLDCLNEFIIDETIRNYIHQELTIDDIHGIIYNKEEHGVLDIINYTIETREQSGEFFIDLLLKEDNTIEINYGHNESNIRYEEVNLDLFKTDYDLKKFIYEEMKLFLRGE